MRSARYPRAPLPGQLLGQVGSLRTGNYVDHVLTGQGEHTSKGVWDHPNLSILKGRVKLRPTPADTCATSARATVRPARLRTAL